MSEHGHHCPFLNRADSRCAENLKIDQLDHAFEYCFDVYAACPVYLDLLIERKTKNADTAPRSNTKPLMHVNRMSLQRTESPNVSRIVQVTVRRSLAHRNA